MAHPLIVEGTIKGRVLKRVNELIYNLYYGSKLSEVSFSEGLFRWEQGPTPRATGRAIDEINPLLDSPYEPGLEEHLLNRTFTIENLGRWIRALTHDCHIGGEVTIEYSRQYYPEVCGDLTSHHTDGDIVMIISQFERAVAYRESNYIVIGLPDVTGDRDPQVYIRPIIENMSTSLMFRYYYGSIDKVPKRPHSLDSYRGLIPNHLWLDEGENPKTLHSGRCGYNTMDISYRSVAANDAPSDIAGLGVPVFIFEDDRMAFSNILWTLDINTPIYVYQARGLILNATILEVTNEHWTPDYGRTNNFVDYYEGYNTGSLQDALDSRHNHMSKVGSFMVTHESTATAWRCKSPRLTYNYTKNRGVPMALIGAPWRPSENSFGARNPNSNLTPQYLIAEVFDAVHDTFLYGNPKHGTTPNQKRKGYKTHYSPEIIDAMYDDLNHVANSIHNLPHEWEDDVVAIASVYNHAQASEFKSCYPQYKYWVFLTESSDFKQSYQEVWINVGTWCGSRFHFQLLRAAPFIWGNKNLVFTCINDTQTNWIPRETRQREALAWLHGEKILCPAMEANSPCPFQDITGFGGSLQGFEDSFCETLVNFGWIYGIDEAWLTIARVPTLIVGTPWGALGGAAHDNAHSPFSSRWLYRIDGVRREITLPQQDRESLWRFVKGQSGRPWCPTYKWSVLERILYKGGRNRELTELTKEEWAHLKHGPFWCTPPLVIFTFGTTGDRRPILGMAHWITKTLKIKVIVVHLLTREQGLNMLKACEEGVVITWVGLTAQCAALVGECPYPYLCPEYLGQGPMGRCFSLAPPTWIAKTRGGGLGVLGDFIYRLAKGPNHWSFSIGAYQGPGWFPRSANGLTFLKGWKEMGGVEPSLRPERVGWLEGSSNIPKPDDIEDIETIGPGDHEKTLLKYTTVYYAGGAGACQTIGAAGARGIAVNDCIDRRYRDPQNTSIGINTKGDPNMLLIHLRHHPNLRWTWLKHPIIGFKEIVAEAFRFPVSSWFWTLWITNKLWHSIKLRPSLGGTILSLFGLRVMPRLQTMIIERLFLMGLDEGSITIRWLVEVLFNHILPMIYTESFRLGWMLMGLKGAMIFWSLPKLVWGIIGPIEANDVICPEDRVAAPDTLPPGTWLTFRPVWLGSFIVGVHSGLYDSITDVTWEGKHQKDPQLGGVFTATALENVRMETWVAIRIKAGSITVSKLPVRAGRYSPVYNCQTLIIRTVYNHPGALSTMICVALLLSTTLAFIMIAIWALALIVAAPIGACAVLITRLDTGALDPGYLQWVTRLADPFIPG